MYVSETEVRLTQPDCRHTKKVWSACVVGVTGNEPIQLFRYKDVLKI